MELTIPNSSNVADLNNIVGGINQVLVVFGGTVQLGGLMGVRISDPRLIIRTEWVPIELIRLGRSQA
jgi:hypothetical protein